MITYHQGSFVFFRSLFRVHGSALHRAAIPSVLSSFLLIVLEYTSYYPSHEPEDRWFNHPYPIACLMAAFTFLLTFKCSFSYNRYWEACTAVHQMQSKWLDIGMELAAFHLQSERFSQIRPQSFGQHPHIDYVVWKRERKTPMTPMKLQEMLQEEDDEYYDEPMANANDELDRSARSASSSISKSRRFRSFLRRRRKGKSGRTTPKKSLSFFHSQYENCSNAVDVDDSRSINKTASKYDESQSLAAGVYSEGVGRRGRGEEVQSKRKGGLARQLSTIKTTADLNGGMTKNAGPSLFLQEASHLLSLLSAVAFATLRNDIESAESPLKDYKPGSPWPPTDPDAEDVDIPYDFYKTNRFKVALKYLLGNNRTAAQRTVYNACRPFSVLGGVSDAEIAVLQRARGPLAKTALCTMWLQEFISREFLNGAFGNVSPPIISRLFQYTSDGMIGYNQARKVAYIPFPFPHSQLTTFFLAAVTLFMPLLMLTFVNEIIVATILNTFAVGVFFGLWMVANELEDPFRNVPNDIPLNNFQAQFNEALVCMFAGFHPEAWWDIDERKDVLNCSKSEEVRDDELLSSIKSNRGNDDVGRNLNDELNASVLDRIKE